MYNEHDLLLTTEYLTILIFERERYTLLIIEDLGSTLTPNTGFKADMEIIYKVSLRLVNLNYSY